MKVRVFLETEVNTCERQQSVKSMHPNAIGYSTKPCIQLTLTEKDHELDRIIMPAKEVVFDKVSSFTHKHTYSTY